MKRAKGDTTYKRRVNGAFQTFPLPQAEEILNSANKLSYSRQRELMPNSFENSTTSLVKKWTCLGLM